MTESRPDVPGGLRQAIVNSCWYEIHHLQHFRTRHISVAAPGLQDSSEVRNKKKNFRPFLPFDSCVSLELTWDYVYENQSLAVPIHAFVSECAQNKQQFGMCPGHIFHPPHGLYVPVLCRAVIKTTES